MEGVLNFYTQAQHFIYKENPQAKIIVFCCHLSLLNQTFLFLVYDGFFCYPRVSPPACQVRLISRCSEVPYRG